MKHATILAAKDAYEETFAMVWESSVEDWKLLYDTDPEDLEDLREELSAGEFDMLEWAILNNK